MQLRNLLAAFIFTLFAFSANSQIVCDFANDSITFCFDKTYVSTGGCSMDSVTTGVFFFSRAEDSSGTAVTPTFQTFSGDDGTGLSPSGNPNEYCITFDVLTWFNVASVDELQKITFAIRNKPGTAYLTSSCVNNPFGYYVIEDLLSVNQQLKDAGGNSIAASFSAERDTVCMDTTSTGISELIDLDDLQVYPNPFTHTTIVRFNQLATGNATVRLIDNIGRVVYRENLESYIGIKEVVLSEQAIGHSLASGLYNIQIIIEDFAISKKVIVR